MVFEVRQCAPAELPHLIEKLDHEFIFARSRTLSLGRRFPALLSESNTEQIFVAVEQGRVAGSIVLRLFDWQVAQNKWRGAMVGMVWVDPIHRGAGLGARLLDTAAQHLRNQAVDFAVLWTGAHSFYRRAGWFLSDHGLVAEVAGRTGNPEAERDALIGQPAACLADAERLRANLCPMRVVRQTIDYSTIPIPALSVTGFCSPCRDGFALVGEEGAIAYFYEMAAPPDLWPTLWSAICTRYERLVVNGSSLDPFTQWLQTHGAVNFRPQAKTMWLPLSSRIDSGMISSWHIPYFDWI